MIALARDAAALLGGDRNDHWTAFGPINVQIHAASIAAELGHADQVLQQAETIQLAALPDTMQTRT